MGTQGVPAKQMRRLRGSLSSSINSDSSVTQGGSRYHIPITSFVNSQSPPSAKRVSKLAALLLTRIVGSLLHIRKVVEARALIPLGPGKRGCIEHNTGPMEMGSSTGCTTPTCIMANYSGGYGASHIVPCPNPLKSERFPFPPCESSTTAVGKTRA
jgi:hypothetical protein